MQGEVRAVNRTDQEYRQHKQPKRLISYITCVRNALKYRADMVCIQVILSMHRDFHASVVWTYDTFENNFESNHYI